MSEDRKTYERRLLACCFLAPEIIVEVKAMVEPEDFAFLPHRKLFESLCASSVASFDLVLVAEAAGWTAPDAVCLADEIVTAAPWKVYADRLVDSRRRHRLADLGARIASGAKEPGSADAVATKAIDELLGEIQKATTVRSKRGGELVYPALEGIEKRMGQDFVSGPRFGISDIDDLTGGMEPSDLIILAARPSVGKTALGLQLALNAATAGTRVAFASIEMADFPVTVRLLSLIGRVSAYRAMHGRLAPSEHEKIVAAGQRLAELPLYVYAPSMATVSEIRAEAMRVRPGLVVVDYLQLIDGDGRENRNLEVAAISRGLKAMAKEMSCPVVALSQLSRPDGPRLPRLTDLRDSGALEQDADVVIFLHEDLDKPKERVAIVAKHRNGPVGQVRLFWSAEDMRMTNLDLGHGR